MFKNLNIPMKIKSGKIRFIKTSSPNKLKNLTQISLEI